LLLLLNGLDDEVATTNKDGDADENRNEEDGHVASCCFGGETTAERSQSSAESKAKYW
jgi:hypothetical protein